MYVLYRALLSLILMADEIRTPAFDPLLDYAASVHGFTVPWLEHPSTRFASGGERPSRTALRATA